MQNKEKQKKEKAIDHLFSQLSDAIDKHDADVGYNLRVRSGKGSRKDKRIFNRRKKRLDKLRRRIKKHQSH